MTDDNSLQSQVLKDGKVVQSGSKYDLMKEASGELAYLIAAHNQTLSQIRSWKEHDSLISTNRKVKQKELRDVKQHNQKGCSEILERSYQKDREFGRVKWHVYHTFVTSAYKGALVPVLLFCQVLFQGLQIGGNYWIAWATVKENRVTKEKLIGIFVLLSASSSLFILGRGVLLANVAFETAQQLFLGMITSIFRAPMSFFDTTPSSQILNRVSSLIFSFYSLLSGQEDITILSFN